MTSFIQKIHTYMRKIDYHFLQNSTRTSKVIKINHSQNTYFDLLLKKMIVKYEVDSKTVILIKLSI